MADRGCPQQAGGDGDASVKRQTDRNEAEHERVRVVPPPEILVDDDQQDDESIDQAAHVESFQ